MILCLYIISKRYGHKLKQTARKRQVNETIIAIWASTDFSRRDKETVPKVIDSYETYIFRPTLILSQNQPNVKQTVYG